MRTRRSRGPSRRRRARAPSSDRGRTRPSCTSGDVAILRATASASESDSAPETAISRSTVAPSPSETISRASAAQTSWSAAASCCVARRAPLEAARAVREQHDSVVRRALAVDRDAVEARVDRRAQDVDRLARLERVVGRDDGEHRREPRMDHPGALRHATDDEAVAVGDGLLRPAVGREDRGGGIRATVRRERCGGVANSCERHVRSAAERRSRPSTGRRPGRSRGRAPPPPRPRSARRGRCPLPVAALATPAFTTTACGSADSRWRLETTTGAARTRFVVHTAAPTAGTVERTSARSGPDRRMPAWTPEATNPRGRSDRHQTSTPESRRPVRLVEPVEEVHVLDRLPGGALARLSSAQMTIASPVRLSSNTPISAPSVCWTRASSGATPSGRTSTMWLSA